MSTTSVQRAAGPVDLRPGATTAGPAARTVVGDRGGQGAAAGLILCFGAMGASVVGLASVIQFAFPVVAVLVVLYFLVRRYWYSVTAYTLVLWLLTAEVRRIADWRTGYHELSLIVITSCVVSLVALPWALASRRKALRGIGTLFAVATVVFLFGMAVGILKNGVVPTGVDVLYLVGPASTGLFVLTVPPDTDRLRVVLQHVATWGLVVVGGYALIQFLVLPPWDAQWMIDTEVSNLGRPEAAGIRAFSTVATTGPLGQIMAVFLLMLVAERRSALRNVAAVLGLIALGVTLVRAGWIGLAIGFVVLIWLGRAQLWRVLVPTLILASAVGLFGGPIVDRVSARVSETATAGTEDTSFAVRLQFQREIAPVALSDPIGDGMGSTGRATTVSGTSKIDPKLQNFDSGIFETLTRYGALAGLALIGTLAVAVGSLVRRARDRPLFAAVCTAAVVALAFNLVFTDTLRGGYGLLLWTLIGYLGRPDPPGPDALSANDIDGLDDTSDGLDVDPTLPVGTPAVAAR